MGPTAIDLCVGPNVRPRTSRCVPSFRGRSPRVRCTSERSEGRFEGGSCRVGASVRAFRVVLAGVMPTLRRRVACLQTCEGPTPEEAGGPLALVSSRDRVLRAGVSVALGGEDDGEDGGAVDAEGGGGHASSCPEGGFVRSCHICARSWGSGSTARLSLTMRRQRSLPAGSAASCAYWARVVAWPMS